MTVEHIFLDFDGTIMVYDEDPGFFHPQVIELLNALPERGVKWYSNSGRGYESQQQILAASIRRGLRTMPEALLCSECFIFTRELDSFQGLEPWNSDAERLLTDYHAQVQAVIRPCLAEWQQFVSPAEMYMHPMATFFQVEEGTDSYTALVEAFSAAVAHVGEGGVVKNGCWIFAQPHAVNKGRALSCYLREHGLDGANVLAVGDHENDLSMLGGDYAAYAGCPGSAISRVKDRVKKAGGYISEVDGPLGTLDVLCHYLH
jgi:hydroxymethylpyrimidine pyrophosphatase-like HAD family hydrolase